MLKRIALAAALGLALAGCQERGVSSNRHLTPIPPQTLSLMASKGVDADDPILIRVFKMESELEVWKMAANGEYALLRTFPICRWSGQLGPKIREGDRQAPEGFYAVTPALMNPNSSFYLSFNTGFPNAFDRAHGRTGSHLMVHGSCTSRGCFAMTDEAIAEVYALAREAFAGGQRAFQFQSFPFRMTPENLAKVRYDQNIAFWRNLKEGYDHFELTRREPTVEVCGGRYSFNTRDCRPVDAALHQLVAERQRRDDAEVARLVAAGKPAVRIVYEDGGGHPSFGHVQVRTAEVSHPAFAVLETPRPRQNLGVVSRPEALAAGPRFVPVGRDGRPIETPAAASAFASAPPAAAPVPVAPTATAALAPAAPSPAPATLAASAAEAPLYQRILGGLFSSLSLGAPEAPAPPEAAPPAAAPAPAAPLPPQRGASLVPGAPSAGYSSLR